MSLKKIPLDTNHIVSENEQKIPKKIRSSRYPLAQEDRAIIVSYKPLDSYLYQRHQNLPVNFEGSQSAYKPLNMYLNKHDKNTSVIDTSNLSTYTPLSMYLYERYKHTEQTEFECPKANYKPLKIYLIERRVSYQTKDNCLTRSEYKPLKLILENDNVIH